MPGGVGTLNNLLSYLHSVKGLNAPYLVGVRTIADVSAFEASLFGNPFKAKRQAKILNPFESSCHQLSDSVTELAICRTSESDFEVLDAQEAKCPRCSKTKIGRRSCYGSFGR